MLGHNIKSLNYTKADLAQARVHGRANRVRDWARVAVDRDLLVCACCNLPAVPDTQNAPLFPLFCSVSELNQLGVGFPLFFYFLRYSLGLCVLVLVGCI